MQLNNLEHLNLSEKKRQYDKNGFCILEKVFTDDEANTFNKFIRRHANKDYAAIINPDRYESLYQQDERYKSDITCEEIEETSSPCSAAEASTGVNLRGTSPKQRTRLK